jgi:O-antigen/teichoic acid export membrane protein
MGIILRQSIKNTLISYIGIAIGTVNTLWLFPAFLIPEEIGLLRLILDIPLLFAYFTQLGASSLSDRFFNYFKDDKKKNNGFLFLILTYPLISFLIFAISFFLLKDFWESIYLSKSALLVDYLNFILPLTFFMMYILILEAYLRANFNISTTSFIREILTRIMFTAIILLYHFKIINIEGIVYLYVFTYALSLVIIFIYIRKINLLHLKPNFAFLNKSLVKELGTYILYLIPGVAGGMIVQKIDSLMLGSMEGLTNVAVYSLAFFIGTVVEVPKKSLSQISIPILSTACKNNELEKIDDLYKKNSILQLLAGIIIFLLIWVNVDELLSLIPHYEIYSKGKYVILFIGLSKLIDMSTSINGEIIQFSRFYKYNILFVVILALLTVVSNFIFIPLYSINGAAFALLANVFIVNIVKTYFIWNKLHCQPFSFKMLHITLFGLIVMIGFEYLHFKSSSLIITLFTITLKSSIIILSYFILIRKFNISADLTALIDRVLLKISTRTGMIWIKKYL